MKKRDSFIFVIFILIIFVGSYYLFRTPQECHHDFACSLTHDHNVKPIIDIKAPLHKYENVFLFFQVVLGVAIFIIAFYLLKKNGKK